MTIAKELRTAGDVSLNHIAALIGAQGGRRRLNTPVLLLDLDVFDKNVATMQAICDANGVRLRPHAKSHKSSRIAREQMEAGAVGVCCATINEAETMAAAGLGGLLITAPLVTDVKIARLRDLCEAAPDTMAVIDNAENARALSAAFENRAALNVLVDLDVGHHRTGAVDPDVAFELARLIAKTPAHRRCCKARRGRGGRARADQSAHRPHARGGARRQRRDRRRHRHARARRIVRRLHRDPGGLLYLYGRGICRHQLRRRRMALRLFAIRSDERA
jgi:hypothetical protein